MPQSIVDSGLVVNNVDFAATEIEPEVDETVDDAQREKVASGVATPTPQEQTRRRTGPEPHVDIHFVADNPDRQEITFSETEYDQLTLQLCLTGHTP